MDREKLKMQLEKYHRQSYLWALSCCSHDPVAAEDVLQTVYLKLLEGRARFAGKSQFKTWLFGVIRNTAADARRRKWLRQLKLVQYRERVDRVEVQDISGEPNEPSALALFFRRALTMLPQRQREILELVFYHNLTIAESAEIMGISLGSARTHYDRAKKRIRSIMEKTKVNDG